MRIELPGGWAQIRSRDEITERQFRAIDRAKTKTVNLSARLIESGYKVSVEGLEGDELEAANLTNLRLVTGLSDADQDAMNDYQMALIMGLTTEWSFGSVVNEVTALDLAKATYEALALACQTELDGTVVDASQAGKDDPLVPGAS